MVSLFRSPRFIAIYMSYEHIPNKSKNRITSPSAVSCFEQCAPGLLAHISSYGLDFYVSIVAHFCYIIYLLILQNNSTSCGFTVCLERYQPENLLMSNMRIDEPAEVVVFSRRHSNAHWQYSMAATLST